MYNPHPLLPPQPQLQPQPQPLVVAVSLLHATLDLPAPPACQCPHDIPSLVQACERVGGVSPVPTHPEAFPLATVAVWRALHAAVNAFTEDFLSVNRADSKK